MLHRDDWLFVPDVSYKHSDFIFNVNYSNNIVLSGKSKHITPI